MAKQTQATRKIQSSAAGKIPPQNLDAETSLLGAILIDQEVLADISDKLKAADFYDKRHATIYEAWYAYL